MNPVTSHRFPSIRTTALALAACVLTGAAFAVPPAALAVIGSGVTGPDATETAVAVEATVATDAGPVPPSMQAIAGIRAFAPGMFSAGQPDSDGIAAAAAAGVRTVINLRPVDEAGAAGVAERAAVAAAGMHYVTLPIAGAADLDRTRVDTFARVLAAAQADGPVLIHCASGNRVGALVALQRAWIDGADAQTALQAGRDAGMTSLAPAVADRIESR